MQSNSEKTLTTKDKLSRTKILTPFQALTAMIIKITKLKVKVQKETLLNMFHLAILQVNSIRESVLKILLQSTSKMEIMSSTSTSMVEIPEIQEEEKEEFENGCLKLLKVDRFEK